MITGRDILLYVSYSTKANWEAMYDLIKRKVAVPEKVLETAKAQLSSNFITLIDEDFPASIRKIGRPPFVLYYEGDITLLTKNANKRVAFIGSRKNSEYGAKATRFVISTLPKDIVVVSGLAKGIDTISHRAALDNGLKTIAVLGSGLKSVYPKENQGLYKEIIDNGGLVISEYFDDIEPKPDNFVARNRIIAALSSVVVVGEAYERSGTQITISYALSYGKEVGCIPYEVNKNSICNALIKDGALLIECGDDVVKAIR